jgi:hypothetical protein
VNTDVLVKMTRVYSTYKQLFLSGGGDARESRSPLAPANRDDAFLGFVKDSFGLYLAACERQFRRPHREFVRLLLKRFCFSLARQTLTLFLSLECRELQRKCLRLGQ